MPELSITIDDNDAKLLAVLSDTGNLQEVIERLIEAARQGVYRPGANEREVVCQIFGDDWVEERMEPGDPYGRKNCGHIFQRPKGWGEEGITLPDA